MHDKSRIISKNESPNTVVMSVAAAFGLVFSVVDMSDIFA